MQRGTVHRKSVRRSISDLSKIYELLRQGEMHKDEIAAQLGSRGTSPDAVLCRFESAGMLLTENGSWIGRMDNGT